MQSKSLRSIQIIQVPNSYFYNSSLIILSSIETQAMIALNLNSQKKKTEAFEHIKKALFKNLGNFTCWHVYGILHRSNK